MDIISELVKKMRNYSEIDESQIIMNTVPCISISQMKLRDYLIKIGTILEYDEGSDIFVAVINAGFGNRNPAVVGLMLQDETLYTVAYAKEGIIHQGTAKKALQKVQVLFA